MTQVPKTQHQPTMDEKKHNPPAHSPEDFHLRIAAAHRPPSTPRLYNLIEIPRDHNLIRVHTRCM
jgi:hypothetical protein